MTTQLAVRPAPSRPATALDGASGMSVLPLALATTHAVRLLTGLRLAPLGVSSGQDRMLIAMRAHGCISVSTLADELSVRPSTVSKMADRLAAKGFLRRLGDETDARRTHLELTAEGQAMAERVIDLCNRIDTELTTSLSPDQVSTMLEGMSLLNAAVDHRLRRLR